jgi:cysteine desulfurase
MKKNKHNSIFFVIIYRMYAKRECPNSIYLDNNATTIICDPARKAHNDWLGCYNASSDSKVSKPVKAAIEKVTDEILAHCETSIASHTLLFTSGGTESNCFIIRASVKAYKKKLLEKNNINKPHVIISAIEHHSIMSCVEDLLENGDIELSIVKPTIYGNILAEDVEAEIKSNTCLISVMFANNEIPIINSISEIGKIAHKHNIPMHSDCVQVFGKFKIDMKKHNIDAVSASSHKFYGPKGMGLLIINNELIEGYNIKAEINGSQQKHLRGGTENVPGIISTAVALKYAFVNRKEKNKKLFGLRNLLLDKLRKIYIFNTFENYLTNQEKNNLELVSLGPPDDTPDFILMNTVLLAVVKNKGRPFCNIELKQYLDKKNIIISIGSACLTTSDKASHVLTAISAPPVVKRGVLRISFGDNNCSKDIDELIVELVNGIKKQTTDIDNIYNPEFMNAKRKPRKSREKKKSKK